MESVCLSDLSSSFSPLLFYLHFSPPSNKGEAFSGWKEKERVRKGGVSPSSLQCDFQISPIHCRRLECMRGELTDFQQWGEYGINPPEMMLLLLPPLLPPLLPFFS